MGDSIITENKKLKLGFTGAVAIFVSHVELQ